MRFTATRNASSVSSPASTSVRDLLAQMVFQLRHVDGVDRLPAAEVAPPLVDLLLERGGMIEIRHRSGSLLAAGGLTVVQFAGTERRYRPPDAPQRGVHRLPLPALLVELRPALRP